MGEQCQERAVFFRKNREETGMTQMELSEAIGIPYDTYRGIEKDVRQALIRFAKRCRKMEEETYETIRTRVKDYQRNQSSPEN